MKTISSLLLTLSLVCSTFAVDDPFLKATNTAANSQFGRAVATSGDTLVIGAPQEDNSAIGINGNQALGNAFDSGAVYVYVRDLFDSASWRLQAYIKAPNAEAGDGFGNSVAISGDTLIVGASLEDGNGSTQANNSATSAGAAYVYKRVANTWQFQAYLKAANAEATDLFGQSVALDGNTAVIGAYGEDGSSGGVNGNASDNSSSAAGAAYVFVRTGSVWKQQAYLKPLIPAAGDYFGLSVAISGNTIVAGAPQDDASAADSGAAHVFIRTGSTWTQQSKLKAAAPGAADLFGWSVSIFGDTIMAGARGEDSNAVGINGDQANNSLSGAGAAYAFTRTGLTWSQQAYLKAATSIIDGRFGTAVAIHGDRVLIGAPADSAGTGNAEVYLRRGNLWAWQETFTHVDPDPGDDLGTAVALSESWMLTGADGDDSSSIHGPNVDEYSVGATNSGCALVYPAAPSIVSFSKTRLAAPGGTDILFNTPKETAVGPADKVIFTTSLTGRGAASGGSNAVFASEDQTTDLVLQTGAAVGGLLDLPSAAKVSSLFGLSSNHTIGAVIQGTITGTGITTVNNKMLFVDYGTHVSGILRTGYPLGAIGTPDRIREVLQSHTFDRLALLYRLSGSLPATDTGLALTTHTGTIIISTPREGSAAPGGGVLGEFVRATFQGSFFSYVAKWIPATGQAPKDALFSLSTRNTPLQGELAGGTTAGERYGTFTGVSRRNTEAILRATLTGSPTATNEGVWSQGGSLLVRKGDDIGSGVKLSKIIRIWGTDSNQLIIHAVLSGIGITSTNNQALLCKPATSSVFQVLARTGQQCPGMPIGARLRSLSAVDDDPLSGRYLVLATLTGVASTSAQAVLSGQTTLGNDTTQVGLRMPNLILRRGQTYHTTYSATDTITSITLRPTLDASGVGGRGLGQTITADGHVVLILKGRSGASEVVRLTL